MKIGPQIPPAEHTFVQQADKLIHPNRGTFCITTPLKGRGQKGLANFYSNGQSEVLIKEDDPATCLLEGSAYFVESAGLIPLPLLTAINFATVGSVSKPEDKPFVISMQDRVLPPPGGKVKPWDEIVYGVKRNPSTLWSYESWYPEFIKQGVAELSAEAQWQLAAGIFGSALAGDESLHVGQFMAILDADNNITGIKRIDLGARERYAVARGQTGQWDPYHASAQYQSSGQFNKDYVNFLLTVPSLNKKYSMLWASLSARYSDEELQQIILEHSKAAYLKQFAELPASLQNKAIEDVLKTINKGTKSPVSLKSGISVAEQAEELAQIIGIHAARRAITLKNKATQKLQLDMKAFKTECLQYFPASHKKFLENCLELKTRISAGQFNLVKKRELEEILLEINELLKGLVNECSQSPNKIPAHQQIRLWSELAEDLIETTRLYQLRMPQKNLELIDILKTAKRYQTLQDTAKYCITSSSTYKKGYVVQIMKHALEDSPENLVRYLQDHPELLSRISAHSSLASHALSQVKTNPSQGYLLLKRLFKHYSIPEQYLTQTPAQRALLADAKKNNIKNIKNAAALSSFSVEDVLASDEEWHGGTVLHYLMKNAHEEDALEAISLILERSIGKTKNTSLDIKDEHGKTPLDYLLDNPRAEKIINYIKAKHIKGYYGGTYLVKDFFDATQYCGDQFSRLKALQGAEMAPKPIMLH